MEEKLCLRCSIKIVGRTDKRFCSDACRNNYNNKLPETLEKRAVEYSAEREYHLSYAKKHKEENWEKYILTSAKTRAKKNGIPFNITVDDIIIPENCPLTGVKLKKTIGRTNSTPSIDKIDNNMGYVKGNVWIISWKANRIKSNLTKDELILFCTKMLEKLQ